MNREYYIKLFEELDDAVYKKVIYFLTKEKFTINGFREIRKIPRKQLVRELIQDMEMMTKTLSFIHDECQAKDLMTEEIVQPKKIKEYEQIIAKDQLEREQMKEKITDLMGKITEYQERISQLEAKVNEMKMLCERTNVLYIGFRKNLLSYTSKYQFTLLEEEDIVLAELDLKKYDEIWLIDNEVASLFLKMKLKQMAKQSGIEIYSFFGEIGLREYLESEVI